MHAWLALLLPEMSEVLIDADPFGVLIYGDAYSLGNSQRSRLLSSLSRLAAADPYFRPEEQAPAAIAALCRPDTTPQLKDILGDQKSPFGMKLLLLDALRVVRDVPPIEEEIIQLVSDSSVPFGLKAPALAIAARLGSSTVNRVIDIYRALRDTGSDIRLRAYIVAKFYAA
jgi:hypothetical protein